VCISSIQIGIGTLGVYGFTFLSCVTKTVKLWPVLGVVVVGTRNYPKFAP
jgi:hypothetical protein